MKRPPTHTSTHTNPTSLAWPCVCTVICHNFSTCDGVLNRSVSWALDAQIWISCENKFTDPKSRKRAQTLNFDPLFSNSKNNFPLLVYAPLYQPT